MFYFYFWRELGYLVMCAYEINVLETHVNGEHNAVCTRQHVLIFSSEENLLAYRAER